MTVEDIGNYHRFKAYAEEQIQILETNAKRLTRARKGSGGQYALAGELQRDAEALRWVVARLDAEFGADRG